MTIELLIAAGGGGKTQACIERIRALKQGDPLAQVWVLVPNPQAAAQFKARLAEAGGSMAVQVGLFQHYYREILEATGLFIPVISQALSHRLIQETVREAFDAAELTHYAAIKDKPGFLSVLRDAFAELRSALVQPQDFLEYTNNAPPARRELAILYQRFLNKLNKIGWTDSEGQSWLAIEALEREPAQASRFSLVIVDGFTAFTAAQRQFLKLLSQQAGEMLITLTGERDSECAVHRRSRKVLEYLTADLSPEIHDVSISQEGDATAPHPFLPQSISHMERHAFETGEVEQLNLAEPIFLEARSQAEEAREALRWIKRLHVRQGRPLSACAIYCANLDTYQPLLRAAANEFGLNIHFSQRDHLAESPAIMAVMNMLSLPLEDFPTRNLLNALHSPYFDFGLSTKDVEDLESVALEAVIVSGREQWNEAWVMLLRQQDSSEDLDEERHRFHPTEGINFQALKTRMNVFWQQFDSIGSSRSETDWIKWLEALLNDLSFYDNITTERDRAACKTLGEVLRALIVSEKVVGAKEVDFGQFLADLQGGLDGAGPEDDRETRKNAVLAGKLVEARAARYQAVALLGFSEGLFPAVENPDPFLDEELRHDLGLDQRLLRDQESTFYQAFTRADSHLLITRPYLSEDGEKWEPSPYWQASTKLFSKSAVIRIQKTDERAQSEAASSQELLFWSVQQGKLDFKEDEELETRRKNLDNSQVVLNARRAKYARGTYEGDLSEVTILLAERFSKEQVWSASRLEAYSDCPYRFFTDSVLNLKKTELPEPGLDIKQVGSLYHRILELVYTKATATRADPLEIVDQVAERVFKTAPEDFGFRPTALWEVEKKQYLENLRLSLKAMEEERGDWQPFVFEKKFGIKGIPCLELEKNGEFVHLRGIIDRVDKNADGEIRVIDYKTGGSMSNSDLVDGTRLQLPIYAAAAQWTLQLGEVADGFYWAINAAKMSSLTLAKFKSEQGEGPNTAHEIVLNHIFNHVNNVRRGKFLPITPKDGCVDYCPASLWCWRYQAKRKYD